jgi:PAS domain S-box-containing protein
MSGTPFIGLVQNAALLLAMAFLFDIAASRWHTGQSSLWQAPFGLAIGTIGVIIMLTPWTFGQGIVFDTRSVLLGISGLFFGTVSTTIAMAMTAAFRFYQGGTGVWTGIAVILASGVIGVTWRHLRRRPLSEISWRELYIFGIVVHFAMLVLMLTLPWATALRVLSNIALPVILIYPLGTALLGVLMVNRLRNEQVGKTLRESEDRYRSLFDNSVDAVLLTASDGRIVAANPEACRIFGCTEEEICQIGRASLLDQTNPHLASALEKRARNGQFRGELTFLRKNGTSFHGDTSTAIYKDRDGNLITSITIRDITKSKQAEEALESERTLLRNLIDNMPDRIYAKDSEGRFIICNEAMIRRMGKTSMTELVGKSDFDLLQPEMAGRFHADEQAIIQTGIPMLNREEPLATEGGKITRWNLATKVPLLDKQGNRIGIVGMGREITDRKQAEQKLKDTLESLRKAVYTTIHVMVSAVEARDPYTAGHQIRSADLARYIATEMGLSQEKIDGIRMAGSIHDIGKLSIPAEILSKPTKLTEIEFSLIREHSLKGYEMLKNVESPWPLAEIVYQHHERMDGSGYPRNLKGNDILIEARILAVADVVEAMASHRPYRPGLGSDVALNEIEKNRGTFYDDAVVDACLRLFRKKGFKFEGI